VPRCPCPAPADRPGAGGRRRRGRFRVRVAAQRWGRGEGGESERMRVGDAWNGWARLLFGSCCEAQAVGFSELDRPDRLLRLWLDLQSDWLEVSGAVDKY
jgi:hypothetical protein